MWEAPTEMLKEEGKWGAPYTLAQAPIVSIKTNMAVNEMTVVLLASVTAA